MAYDFKNWCKQHKILSTALFNVSEITFLILIHTISPTNMAGPGLDLPIFIILFISSGALTLRSLAMIAENKIYWICSPIYLAGLACLICFLVLPSNELKFW
jgi:hypothetical protein